MSRLFVNRLTVLDFSYLHPRRGLLGESWLVDIELRGDLDAQGMVLDFGDVKREVKKTLDERFDHRLLVPANHPGLTIEASNDPGRFALSFTLDSGETLRFNEPEQAIALIDAEQITESALAAAAIETLRPLMPGNVDAIRLVLTAEAIDGAYFHYSHGLKHHFGNCQRIAHGHRSRIQIYADEQRAYELESDWATRWRDIYIASEEDLAGEFERNGVRYLRFAYTAAQGAFELELPARSCYLMAVDTTIEHLAQHMADVLKQEHPERRFSARVFEGIDKGAVGES
jgi:6-pyruvoyl-tetrahydropterin synthase